MITRDIELKVKDNSYNKADFLVALNQFDDAIEVWEAYLQLFPKDKKAYEKMGISIQ